MICERALIDNQPETLTQVVANLLKYWGYSEGFRTDLTLLLNEFMDWQAKGNIIQQTKNPANAFADFLDFKRQSINCPFLSLK